MATKPGRPKTKEGGRKVSTRLSEEAADCLDLLMTKFDCNQTDALERVLAMAGKQLRAKNSSRKSSARA